MIFELLAKEFQFTLDAAADISNAKCDLFFTREKNALKQDWGQHTVWLNCRDPSYWALVGVKPSSRLGGDLRLLSCLSA